MFYITQEKAQKILNTHNSEDIAEIIADAVALFEASLGRSLKKQQYTRYIDGNGSHMLYLEIIPDSIESVSIDGRNIAVEYIDGLMVVLASKAEKGRKNVKISYTAGYEVCPTDVMKFFENFLKDITDSEKILQKNPLGIKSQKIGDLSITYATPEELNTLGAGARVSSPAMQAIFEKYKVFSLHSTL